MQALRDLGPAHPGHDDVDQRQRDRSRVCLRDLDRFVWAWSRQHLIAVRREAVTDGVRHGRLVVENQDGRAGDAHRRPSRAPCVRY